MSRRLRRTALGASSFRGRRPAALPGRLGLLRTGAWVAVGVGAALLAAAGLRATLLAPATQTSQRLTALGAARVVSTGPGALDLSGRSPSVRIDVTGASGQQVFIGIGRAADVAAYLGQARQAEVTGLDPHHHLEVAHPGTEATLPDPTGVDVWAVSEHGQGQASLIWPQTPGQWRAVIAGDGSTTVPRSVTLTWDRTSGSSPVPLLLTLGLVLLILGGALLLLIRTGLWPGGPGLAARDGRGRSGSAGSQLPADEDAEDWRHHARRRRADAEGPAGDPDTDGPGTDDPDTDDPGDDDQEWAASRPGGLGSLPVTGSLPTTRLQFRGRPDPAGPGSTERAEDGPDHDGPARGAEGQAG